jgi:predicted nucleic acid-binding protein
VTGPVYLETSALLAWLLGEPAGDIVRQTLDGAPVVVTSRLTLVEAARGLLRAEHERRLSAAERHALTGMLAAAAAGWFRLAIADATCERAERPFPIEPVRTLDALHLASALMALEVYPELTVLTLDDRVMANAGSLGLPVMPVPASSP